MQLSALYTKLVEENTANIQLLESTKIQQNTTEKLEVTEKALDRTQAKLVKTTQQRDEQIHLVENHVENEGRLQSEAHNVSRPELHSVFLS